MLVSGFPGIIIPFKVFILESAMAKNTKPFSVVSRRKAFLYMASIGTSVAELLQMEFRLK